MKYYVAGYRPSDNYLRGMLAIEEGDLQRARKILSEEPIDSRCYGMASANLAQTEIRLEKYAEAETSARAALRIFLSPLGCPHPPTFVQAYRNLGESLSQRDHLNEAVEQFQLGCAKADELKQKEPDFAEDCELEKGHLLNSLAGAVLRLGDLQAGIEYTDAARQIYRKYPQNMVGLPETLTTLGLLYNEAGRKTEAELALNEAEALSTDNPEQLWRVKTAKARMNLLTEADKEQFFSAANQSIERELYDNAYLQYCIAAYLANEIEDFEWGRKAIDLAVLLESKLDVFSFNLPKLSFYKATFREKAGADSDEVISILIDGAKKWCERLPGTLQPADYQEAIARMHDHFRKLGSKLLAAGRTDEAFVAFEMGRARAFASQALGTYEHPFLKENPFGDGKVDCSLLARIKAGLKQNEVLVSLAVFALTITAFVVGKDLVETTSFEVSAVPKDLNDFASAIRTLPEALHAKKGKQAIPRQILELAAQMAKIIAGRNVVVISPHNLLHQIPWRTLLHDAGLPWQNLACTTQFSPFLNPDHPSPDTTLNVGAIALGFGTAGILSLEDEAKEFANVFASNGSYRVGSRAEVQKAFLSDKIVLLSCHGKAVAKGTTLLYLEDGSFSPDELFGEHVNCALLILSACESGVYGMAEGDYPVGAAPQFLLAGAPFCVCTRFSIGVGFARKLFPSLAAHLAAGQSVANALALALEEMEKNGADLWKDIACVELVSRGIPHPSRSP
jgi:tetratricopeptide (TPR) repeat protein